MFPSWAYCILVGERTSDSARSRCPRVSACSALFLLTAGLLLASQVLLSREASATAIRLTPGNPVPRCVTPNRLMAFLREQNPALPRRFNAIAEFYMLHGEDWRVRWDYAFFQMVVETNFLRFRKGNGQPGDVHISQNNFAGLGATGGGVAGDRYSSVSEGVLAQIQHLVVYSGERVGAPIGHRTRLKQDDILRASHAIASRRAVTFQDLAGRWAADKRYGRTISTIAKRFFDNHCRASRVTQQPSSDAGIASSAVPKPVPVRRTHARPGVRTATDIVAPPLFPSQEAAQTGALVSVAAARSLKSASSALSEPTVEKPVAAEKVAVQGPTSLAQTPAPSVQVHTVVPSTPETPAAGPAGLMTGRWAVPALTLRPSDTD